MSDKLVNTNCKMNQFNQITCPKSNTQLMSLDNIFDMLISTDDEKWNKNWSEEVADFHQFYDIKDELLISGYCCIYFQAIIPSDICQMIQTYADLRLIKSWKHEISPIVLEKLLSKLQNNKKQTELLESMTQKLIGTDAINRILDLWLCMVSYMPFPMYTHEDICSIFIFEVIHCPTAGRLIQNILLDSSGHFVDSIMWLAEMLRFKLKQNVDIVFQYTFSQDEVQTTMDNKAYINNIIDEFIAVVSDDIRNLSCNMKALSCEETINIGKLIYWLQRKLSQTGVKSKMGSNGNQYDNKYYEAMHSKNLVVSLDKRMSDINEIRHVSYIYWSNMKHLIIRNVVQKCKKLILTRIKQPKESNENMIASSSKEVSVLMNRLVDITGVDTKELMNLIAPSY